MANTKIPASAINTAAMGLLITLLQHPRKRRQRRIQRRQRIARRPIIRPRQFPAFVGLSLMVGYRTDHHPLVMQSWLRKRRTICRAKPSRIGEDALRGWYWAGVIVSALALWVVWYMLVRTRSLS